MQNLFIKAGITICGVFILCVLIAGLTKSNRVSRPVAALSSQATSTPTPARLTLEPSYYRLQMETEYLHLINEVNHGYYNHVEVKVKKAKGGYTLYAYHSFFNQYQFQIGNFGKEVQAWVSKNYATLKLAKIIRVGVYGTGAYASGTYYEVR